MPQLEIIAPFGHCLVALFRSRKCICHAYMLFAQRTNVQTYAYSMYAHACSLHTCKHTCTQTHTQCTYSKETCEPTGLWHSHGNASLCHSYNCQHDDEQMACTLHLHLQIVFLETVHRQHLHSPLSGIDPAYSFTITQSQGTLLLLDCHIRVNCLADGSTSVSRKHPHG